MNSVCLVGRITRDLELKQSGETSYLSFSLAVNRRFKREGQPEADFPSIKAFGKTAEFISKYFGKGDAIGITGRIQTGSYLNKDNNKVYTTDVIAENVEFVGSKKNSDQGNSDQGNEFVNLTPEEEMELPFN